MQITRVAHYLVSQMTHSAPTRQQQSRENASNQEVTKPQKERQTQQGLDSNQTGYRSSAYRVTLSPAALQKMATGRS